MKSDIQKNRTQQYRAERRSFSRLSAVPVLLALLAGWVPQHAEASTPDAQFRQYLFNICANPPFPIPNGWDQDQLSSMCQLAFPGGFAGGGAATTSSSNVGTANAGSGLSTRKKKIRVPLDEQSEKSEKGASADGGGWGLLLSPQYSKSIRPETDQENGYQSDLSGLVIGLDYRFSDSFVLGAVVGQTKDKAVFLNNAGSLKTSNNTLTMYGTWLPSEKVSVDGYLGYGKISFDSQRKVDFALIQGMINGSTTGNQSMAGMSTSYQLDAGRFNVSPFLNLDYVKTSFKGYNESGSTIMVPQGGGFPPLNYGTSTLALHYFDRSTISFTSSLGARVGTSYGYDWGTLLPSVRLATVHEFQNKAQQIRNELISTPGFGMSVATDTPDRNYLLSGLGVAAALNGGAQLFFDFEKRSQDRLMSNWAVSLGALVEF